VRIVNRADELADANEHVKTILGSPLFVDVLDHDDHAGYFVRLIPKRNTQHARPDLFSVFSRVKHFVARTHRLTSHRSCAGPFRWIEQAAFVVPTVPTGAQNG